MNQTLDELNEQLNIAKQEVDSLRIKIRRTVQSLEEATAARDAILPLLDRETLEGIRSLIGCTSAGERKRMARLSDAQGARMERIHEVLGDHGIKSNYGPGVAAAR